MNDVNSPLDPFVYNNPYFPTDLSRSQYYYQTGGGVDEQVQQIIMQYAELAGASPEQIVEELKGLSEEQVQEQLVLMAEEIEEAQQQEEMLRKARQQEDEDVSVEGEDSSMMDFYDPEDFEEKQNMIMANVQAENNQQMVEEEEQPVQQEPTEAQSYRDDKYKYGGAKKKFLSKLKKAMNGMAADVLPKVSFDKDDYGQNMLGSFVQGVQQNSQRALEAEAAEKVQQTLSQNPQMMMPAMAQYGMQMYNPMATLSENAMGGMDYLSSIAPTNQDIQNSFGNMAGAFANDFLPQQKRGGTLPIFQNTGQNNLKQQGKDYFRKVWERTKGVNIPEAQKQQLFDAWYAGQKAEDWKDILPQAPGGNYFNQAPTNQMFNNPWGYRAYNNPYLQQFAYAPRYKASVDGKKININNLQDWSDANLIQTEQMTNRRGRVTGTRYKLQKPSSVIRTEQPVVDPNYSVPKVDDVMLPPPAPAPQSSSWDPNVITSTNGTGIQGAVSPVTIGSSSYGLNSPSPAPQPTASNQSTQQQVPALVKKNNDNDPLEISDEKRKKFDETIKNAPQGTTIETVPKQYGGPFLVPYSNEYMAQQYADYKNFYDDYTRPPSTRGMGDGYDAYDSYMRKDIKKQPVYGSGWLEEYNDGVTAFIDETDNSEPKPSSKYKVKRVDNQVIGYQNDPIESRGIADLSRAMAWQNAADKRKNNFPQNTYPGFLKSQQTGGQLYLYKNGGLPKFQGPDISQVLAKPKIDPNLVYNTQQYNKEYDLPQETLDITETTKPNFLQGVARAMPYMNFANNMYDRISAENQRNKLRQQATSIEGIASPISDYKGRFSEYGAYQPNLQGFQGMGSAKYGGMIGDGEYYLSDSEIQDIISMGGEVEFLED